MTTPDDHGPDDVDLEAARRLAGELAAVASSLFLLLQPAAVAITDHTSSPADPSSTDDEAAHSVVEADPGQRTTALLGEIGFLDD